MKLPKLLLLRVAWWKTLPALGVGLGPKVAGRCDSPVLYTRCGHTLCGPCAFSPLVGGALFAPPALPSTVAMTPEGPMGLCTVLSHCSGQQVRCAAAALSLPGEAGRTHPAVRARRSTRNRRVLPPSWECGVVTRGGPTQLTAWAERVQRTAFRAL